MTNYSNGDQVERSSDLSLVNFLEQCWQMEVAAEIAVDSSEIDLPLPSMSLIEIDETGQGYPALSRARVALWMPLIWLYL